MLGRSGVLGSIPCPFLASGLCERPYCHFGHEQAPHGAPISEPAAFTGYMASMEAVPCYSQEPLITQQPPGASAD